MARLLTAQVEVVALPERNEHLGAARLFRALQLVGDAADGPDRAVRVDGAGHRHLVADLRAGQRAEHRHGEEAAGRGAVDRALAGVGHLVRVERPAGLERRHARGHPSRRAPRVAAAACLGLAKRHAGRLRGGILHLDGHVGVPALRGAEPSREPQSGHLARHLAREGGLDAALAGLAARGGLLGGAEARTTIERDGQNEPREGQKERATTHPSHRGLPFRAVARQAPVVHRFRRGFDGPSRSRETRAPAHREARSGSFADYASTPARYGIIHVEIEPPPADVGARCG